MAVTRAREVGECGLEAWCWRSASAASDGVRRWRSDRLGAPMAPARTVGHCAIVAQPGPP